MSKKINVDSPTIQEDLFFKEVDIALKNVNLTEKCCISACKNPVTHVVIGYGGYKLYCFNHSNWDPKI